MGRKKGGKRKKSSDSDQPQPNKEQRKAGISPGPLNDSVFDNTQNGSFISLLADDHSVFNGQVVDNMMQNQNMIQCQGTMAQYPQYVNMAPQNGMNPMMNCNFSQQSINTMPTTPSQQMQSTSKSPFNGSCNTSTPQQAQHNTMSTVSNVCSKNVSNTELMQYMSSRFDGISKRLEKLESVEKKVDELDMKINKLWNDLDKRITLNTTTLNELRDCVDSNDYEVDEARREVKNLREQHKSIKESLCDIQAKSMMNNLIIGGVREDNRILIDADERNTADDGQNAGSIGVERDMTPEETVTKFMKDNLKISQDKVNRIKVKRVQRIGRYSHVKPRNLLVEFESVKDKELVKSYRRNLDGSGMYIHDQFPQEIVALRKKLVPIMKRAKGDGKSAYIKYNKLIIDGVVYTDGPYGKVPE